MPGTSYFNRRRYAKQRAGWQESVADIMEKQGKFIPNEKLNPKHPKIKNPHKFQK